MKMQCIYDSPHTILFNHHHQQQPNIIGYKPHACVAEVEGFYECDEFRMYEFKIRRCRKTRSHDWTVCPFAHRGEKATRRDPRRFGYLPISCPEFRGGECFRGEACGFSHGVFEYWLHPGKYRTRVCNAGVCCNRKVCFFAHTAEELRPEMSSFYHCPFIYRKDEGEVEEEWVAWVRELTIGGECGGGGGGGDECAVEGGEEWEVPDIGWVSELVS